MTDPFENSRVVKTPIRQMTVVRFPSKVTIDNLTWHLMKHYGMFPPIQLVSRVIVLPKANVKKVRVYLR